MDLLDRYLAAVGRELPEAQRADVVAELRDDLLSMIEAEEDRLGRPQTRAELEAMLVAFGHPLQVAGRYRKVQHLIGPDIFPFWWAWLRAALIIVATVYVVLAAVQAFSRGDFRHFLQGIDVSLVEVLVFTFGAVTLAAAAVERWGGKAKVLTQWKPSELPPVRGKPPSQFERVLELAMSLVFLGWWAGVVHFRNWMPNDVRLEMAQVWAAWFWPILVYAVFECFCRFVALVRPGRVRSILVLNIVRRLTAAAILGAVVQAGHFVNVVGAPEAVQATVDRGMVIGFSLGVLGCVLGAAKDAWRLWRVQRDDALLGQPA